MAVGTESPSSEAVPNGKHRTLKGRGCNRCVYMSGSNPSDCTRAVKSTSGLQDKRERSLGRCLSSRSPAGPGCGRPPVLTPMLSQSEHPGVRASCRVLPFVDIRGCRLSHSW